MKRGILLLLLLMLPLVTAEPLKEGSINLLAMAKDSRGTHGTVAKLSLEIRPGSERVYLETFPLTQVTTQASLRFAQQIACNTLDIDCAHYDFYYTIHALPGIVGGPSAGSSAALLTAAMLSGLDVPDDIAATGTINSGGIIGPVGGVDFKILAASDNGIRKVFIPKGTKNLSINGTEMSEAFILKAYNVSVVEVAEFRELLNYSLGLPFLHEEREFSLDERYSRIMNDVGLELCDRSSELLKEVDASAVPIAVNYTVRADEALRSDSPYAAASFCFRANVEFRKEMLRRRNLSADELHDLYVELSDEIESARVGFGNRSIRSLTDLQTFMAVMERVDDAQEYLEDHNASVENLAYAEERLYSALAWARFFDGGEEEWVLDDDALLDSCISKLSEAEERLNYIGSVLPATLKRTRSELDHARSYLFDGDYVMCLFTAAKAKSETNVILNLMGVEESDFDEIIGLKLRIANNAVAKSLDKGVFPIIAYSYLEYAKSLRPLDRVSSLLFAEYALELSNLDIYFAKDSIVAQPVPPASTGFSLSSSVLAGIGIGMIIGSLCTLILINRAEADVRRKTLAGTRKRLRGKKR